MRHITTLFTLWLVYAFVIGQNNHRKQSLDTDIALQKYAYTKQMAYERQKQQINRFVKKYQLTPVIQSDDGGIQTLEWIKNNRPVYQMTHNIGAATTISAELLWPAVSSQFDLDGSNVQLGIWDGGKVYGLHQEFAGQDRLWQRDTPVFFLAHSTHIAGTIGALGVNPLSKGIANHSYMLAYDYSNDIAEMALAASEGLALSNHSYGTVCGWKYNQDAESWHWYGDTSMNPSKDEAFGLYDSTAWEVDYLAYLAPHYLMVKSAGNDRSEGPKEQPISHYDWNDGWQKATDSHEVDGGSLGYDCLTPKAVAKNNLVIGSVLDLTDGYTDAGAVKLASYSAWGPANDGRIKPDLVANGETVLSSVNSANDAYETYSGTSMAAASVSGSIALLLQLQQQLTPGTNLLSSTLKGILINTASECGPSSGPDYQFGWGLMNTFAAAICLENNYASGGALIHEGEITPNQTITYPITIGENQDELKITLCWTDPPGQVQDITQLKAKNLINDIDLCIENITNGEIYHPWVLNPDEPSMPAYKGINNLDNVEQVHILTPPPGEYLIKLFGKTITEGPHQSYSLIINKYKTKTTLYPPKNLSYRIGSSQAQLYWQPSANQPLEYTIYCDDQPVAQTKDTTYLLSGLTNGTKYSYNVRAKYDNEKYSLPTNTVELMPFEAVSTPFITDFESGLNNWHIKESIDGWRIGNKDSLTSYYLNLEDNISQFIWIDSGINKWHSHVTDVAASPPINLENHSNITVSFKYVFVTGIYNVIDQLHLVYRQVGDTEWTKVMQPAPSSKWLPTSVNLPPEASKPNIQIGFFYDDFYLHGMGAAIDDVSVTSSVPTLINEERVSHKVTICNNQINVISSEIMNGVGIWELIDLTGRTIESGDLYFTNGQAMTTFKQPQSGLYIVRINHGNTLHSVKVYISE